MRIAVLIAVSVLVAGCSQAVGGDAEQTKPTASAPSSTTNSRPPPTSTKPPPTPPPPDTPIAGVIAWIEEGSPVDAAGFHSATRDGTTTQLGNDVAFTTPSGKTTCMTDAQHSGGALACLVQLTDPPPRPESAYGEWVGGWVDFDGATITVGSVRGDPGRFTNGNGPKLGYGDSLSFGDYRCRADPVGLYCVNYAHQSAARFSDTGIAPYACAKQVTPPVDIGEKWVC
jgi:hypothetical protein